jgi:putative flippase GtrA
MIITRQFVTYVSIGIVSAMVDITILKLSMLLHVGFFFATLAGYIFGLIVNYFLHSFFTFKSSVAVHRMFRYLILVFINYWLTVVLVFFSISFMNDAIYGKIISLPIVAIIGFFASKKWIYNS